jgi:hypothetical protein
MYKLFNRISSALISIFYRNQFLEKYLVLQGSSISKQLLFRLKIDSLADVEFSVFSQWGEDGIIEWLIQQNGDMPEIFIEFGVENFRESNCRFLLIHRNWRGLVIDGNQKCIDIIRKDNISWRHDLSSICEFITRENINFLIQSSSISGEIGFLSVDLDGNDYWIWESIECVSPHFVIVEYNSAFGDLEPITVPYKDDFIRSKAHSSNLYYGASIMALSVLASKRGYTLLGSNRAGSNAFFVRNDRLFIFESLIKNKKARPSRFKESRDFSGHLNFIRGLERSEVIKEMTIIDVINGENKKLSQIDNLYSEEWSASIKGI